MATTDHARDEEIAIFGTPARFSASTASGTNLILRQASSSASGTSMPRTCRIGVGFTTSRCKLVTARSSRRRVRSELQSAVSRSYPLEIENLPVGTLTAERVDQKRKLGYTTSAKSYCGEGFTAHYEYIEALRRSATRTSPLSTLRHEDLRCDSGLLLKMNPRLQQRTWRTN